MFQIQKQLIAMKMDIFHFFKVTDIVLIIQTQNGIKKKLNFLVGDSFVMGNCVNRPHDISSVLREISNKSVLNIGYANNGTLLEYASLKEYIIPNIKNIIWVYYEKVT